MTFFVVFNALEEFNLLVAIRFLHTNHARLDRSNDAERPQLSERSPRSFSAVSLSMGEW